MNFVLRTAHAEEKKKGNPDVRTKHIYIEIADVPSMWGSLRSPNNENSVVEGVKPQVVIIHSPV